MAVVTSDTIDSVINVTIAGSVRVYYLTCSSSVPVRHMIVSSPGSWFYFQPVPLGTDRSDEPGIVSHNT